MPSARFRTLSTTRRALVLLLLAVSPSASRFLSRRQVIGCCCTAAVPLAIECYSRAPPRWAVADLPQLPSLEASTDSLVFVLHGAGGPDVHSSRIADALRGERNTQVFEYDWLAYVGDQLRAPYNAQRIGNHLAEEVIAHAAKHPLRKIHVVGISVGAFAADRLVEQLAKVSWNHVGGRPLVRLTLLDPFTARGLPGLIRPSSAYGINIFGKAADECVCVLNTDDPVPSTSLPLRNAVNFDITSSYEREAFEPLPGDTLHSWPAAWFGLHPRVLDSVVRGERGSTIAVD